MEPRPETKGNAEQQHMHRTQSRARMSQALGRVRHSYRRCERQTFTDRLPMIAAPYARRTRRVGKIVGLLGYSTGGVLASGLMQRLGLPVSNNTILRQLKRDATVAHRNTVIRVVGIEDWSWRRATSYGTVMVDLERRSVVDILNDRSVESAAKWLRTHPSVEVVSRDRCGLYAQAVREGAPQARQVDDAIDSELIPIMRFARVLRRDIDAVNNAIELP